MNSKGDVVDERLLIRYMYITFSTVRPLCFVRLRDAFETTRTSGERPFCHFLGEVLRKMAKRDATESSAAPRRRPKRHTWQWNGSLHTKRLSTVSSLYVVHAHTQYAYNNICTHLFCIEHPTPNTQKKKGRKKKGKTCVTLHFINRARARVQNRSSRTRASARTPDRRGDVFAF